MNQLSSCLFCKIAQGAIPSQVVWQDDELMAFYDIHPKAPVHVLMIPKQHAMASIADMTEDQSALVGRMAWRAKHIAEGLNIAELGYRLIWNVRSHGGQEVDHVHLHILGGKPLGPLLSE